MRRITKVTVRSCRHEYAGIQRGMVSRGGVVKGGCESRGVIEGARKGRQYKGATIKKRETMTTYRGFVAWPIMRPRVSIANWPEYRDHSDGEGVSACPLRIHVLLWDSRLNGWLVGRWGSVRARSAAQQQGGSALSIDIGGRGHGHGGRGERPNKEMARRAFDCAGGTWSCLGYSCRAHLCCRPACHLRTSPNRLRRCKRAVRALVSTRAQPLALLSKPHRLLGLLLQRDSKVAGPPARHAAAQRSRRPCSQAMSRSGDRRAFCTRRHTRAGAGVALTQLASVPCQHRPYSNRTLKNAVFGICIIIALGQQNSF